MTLDMSQNMISYRVNVSIKLTSPPFRVLNYNFSSTISTKNMFEYLSTKIRHEFGLMPVRYHIVVYEDPENIPCDRNIIAPIAQQYRLTPGINDSIILCINLIEQEQPEEEDIVVCCPVCLEEEIPTRLFIQRYICGHPICSECFLRCICSNNLVCPLCRQSQL